MREGCLMVWGFVLCWDRVLEITWRIVRTTTLLPIYEMDLGQPVLNPGKRRAGPGFGPGL